MEQREIFVTLLSAQDLKKVSAFGKMAVYAVAWVNPSEKVSSPVDKSGNLNPTWNATLKLTADERRVEDGNAVLVVDLYDHGTFGNTHVGSCTIPLSGLKPPAKASEKGDDKTPSTEGSSSSSASFMAVPVLRKSGKAKGTLNLSVRLGDLVKHRAPLTGTPLMGAAPPSYMAAGKGMPGSQDKGAPAYAYPAQGYPPAYGQPGYGAPGGAQPYPTYQQAPYEQAQYQQPPYQQPPYQQGQYQQPPYQQAPYQQGPYQQPPPYFPPGGYAAPPPPPPQRRSGLGGMGGGLGLGLAGGALGGLLLGSALDGGGGDGGGDGGGGGGCGGGGCGGGCGG